MSHKSDSDRRSRSSCSSSLFTQKLKAAGDAAEMKELLKYHDIEVEKRSELERLNLKKKLDVAEARLRAIDQFERDMNYDADLEVRLPDPRLPDETISKDNSVNEYVRNIPSPLPPVLTPHYNVTSDNNMENPPGCTSRNLVNDRSPNHNEFPHPSHHTNQPNSSNVPTVVFDPTNLCKVLSEQAVLNRLPPPEPHIFSGDPLQYPTWKASFETLIENRHIPLDQRMYYLQKYLSGPAKACVENFFLFNTEHSYNDAKSLLERRYGHHFVISNAFRDKLESWPKIQNRDSEGLRSFGDFLRQCESALTTIYSLNILNDSRENRKLLAKLPDWLVSRWSRFVYDYQQKKNYFPPFHEFVSFITREAEIACDPITSLTNLKRETNPSSSHSSTKPNSYPSKSWSSKFADQKKGNNSVTLNTETNVTKGEEETVIKNYKKCFNCKGSHHISECAELNKKPLEERKKYYFTNSLCFGCLNFGHKSQNCRNRLKCKQCSKLHPTPLHGDFRPATVPDKSEEKAPKMVTSHTSYNNVTAKNKSAMVVPVYLSHDDDPTNELLIYALEDTLSDTTFILSKSANELNLKGVSVDLLLSTMTASNQKVESIRYTGLSVRGYNGNVRVPLPPTYSRDIMPANRSHIPVPSMVDKWPHLETVRDKLHPLLDCDVALLIGYDCPKALAPINVVPPVDNGPFAQETLLGWGIVGVLDWEPDPSDNIGLSHRIMTSPVSSVKSDSVYVSCPTRVKELIDPKSILKMFELDFNENNPNSESLSNDDKLFLDKMNKGIHKSFDDKYEMPLPFKGPDPHLPNNKSYAINRMRQLEIRLRRDSNLYNDYATFMSDIIDNGYAELVPNTEQDTCISHTWYIPHHSVYHPSKKKIRVVFDCNSKFNGSSLNDCLLKGPDLTNTLIGVLCRFRKEPYCITCDIQKMFYQFKVDESHRNYLRFLWWKDHNVDSELVEYRMTVHLFGAASSPGCANFGLKQAANDNEKYFDRAVSDFIRDDFYVDDGLKSFETESEAINVIQGSKNLLSKCGINLHKFISNSCKVIESIPVSDRAQGIQDIDLCVESLPIERVLGVHWHVEADTFNFHVTLKDKPLTRRGILSTISSIYDPLGFIAPFILRGKRILQELCKENIDWDDQIPDHLRSSWENWRTEVLKLKSVELDRCLKPKDFGTVKEIEIHHFSDASSTGYGQCSYIRFVNERNSIHCALVIGKSRVIPLRAVTIPRLELTAAVVSVRVSQFLQKELKYQNMKEIFWTDSNVVMGYIQNDIRRFQTFVANRVQVIRDHTDPSQWNYVKSNQNPADIASRGANVEELINDSDWFCGPKFLWTDIQYQIRSETENFALAIDDPELKKSVSFVVQNENSLFELNRLHRFSNWFKLKRAIANCIKFKRILRNRVSVKLNPNNHKSNYSNLSVDNMCEAETEIIKHVQYESFKTEIDYLRKVKNQDTPPKKFLKKSSSLFRLDPFLNSKGLLCVGGRLRRSNLGTNCNHPVILPRKHHVTNLIIRHYHELTEHQGRGITVNTIRSNGFWIIGCTSAVYEYIRNCINCRKYRGKQQDQKMADVPAERLEPSSPFTVCGVDCFGPFLVTERRKTDLKRYGLLFTCLCSRAVHIETLNSMSTDSFINGLRRFIAIRGTIRSLYCDNGSNFVGAQSELFDVLKNLDQESIRQYLLRNNCDYFEFKFNVPNASHMGGIWERQIRSVRNVLISLLSQCGTQLDDEMLSTFMHEAAAIVNSRPLTVDNLNDINSCEPLTPNHLLTMKSNIILPPPGNFVKEDIYSRKRWRRVQYMCNVFWSRWKVEYLQNLQLRQKWTKPSRNYKIGDIVLLKDDNIARNQWNLCRIVEVVVDSDNLVRKAKILVGDRRLNSKGKSNSHVTYLERPVHKLILVVESDL